MDHHHHQHHQHHHYPAAAHNSSGHNDFLHANKEYFDNLGQQYDQVPGAIPLAQK
jgi:hypothetical protein